MLEEIRLAQVATYPDDAEILTGLRRVNFIFGTNGSGKTTISRIIADPNAHPACGVSWAGGRTLDTLVYNTHFVEKNFTPQMPGIFTLGKAEAETIRQIEESRRAVEDYVADIANKKKHLGVDETSGFLGERKTLRDQFEEICWKLKTAYDGRFQGAFEGLRNSKSRFCDRVLHESDSNQASLQPIGELESRAATVFADDAAILSLLATIDGRFLLDAEAHPILQKKVVGKEDVDIGALIRRLGNSDWVRQGLKFAEPGAACPFCQKEMEADLLDKLNAFFDEAYLADLDAIDHLRDGYSVHSGRVLELADATLTSGNAYIDAETFRPLLERLRTALAMNSAALDRKRYEPSRSANLEPIEEALSAVVHVITQANAEITRHNGIVANLKSERTLLTSEIWKYLIEEHSDAISSYNSGKSKLDKAISGLTEGISKTSADVDAARATLSELERQVTSVQPVVTEINATLVSFGFTSFRLETAGENGEAYRIIRGDGSDARETLSEGERSFITFLYFYHLVRGSVTATGVTTDRIIVFDDPVCSLDSDVLFIVSALIKRILAKAIAGDTQIKQVFVLTHNVYFHKEVSFDSSRPANGCRAFESFWTVRKVESFSRVEGHASNPVRTSYELLWAEVKNPNRSTLTIQNVLRRILEHYFTILGSTNKTQIIEMFDGRDAMYCASLLSWVNDGSHNFADDLYVATDAASIERYLKVFKAIFEDSGHGAHYRMMFGPEPEPVETSLPVEQPPAALVEGLLAAVAPEAFEEHST